MDYPIHEKTGIKRSFKRIARLVRLRFVMGRPTEELMQNLKTPKERWYMAAIALLDISELDFQLLLTVEPTAVQADLTNFRKKARKVLQGYGYPN